MSVNEIIKSKDNKNIKYLMKLNNPNFKNEERCFVSFDLNFIEIANEKKLVKSVYLTKKLNKYKNEILISEELMSSINKISNIIAIISYIPEKEIIEDQIIYLDEIRDPVNLAKIIYLMNKFNYKRLIISKNSISIYNSKFLQEVSCNLFNINISIGDINTIKSLKERGYKLYSTGLKSSIYLNDVKEFKTPFILVFGNEARGVCKEILDISDSVIKIEMSNMDSLNIAVAASIIFNSIK